MGIDRIACCEPCWARSPFDRASKVSTAALCKNVRREDGKGISKREKGTRPKERVP
jgi:hypothetical protein